MTANTNRRRFLQLAGSATVASLAGCAGTGGDSADPATETEEMMTEEDDGMEDYDGMMEETDDEMMEGDGMMEVTDPEDAPRASIDRFSDAAGTLMVRSENGDLPGADEPIDFDQGPFITKGLGPDGEMVEYYNFDVQPTNPAPIYAFFREGEDEPVEGQLNVVDVVPGDDGYNDFWHVHRVTVPSEDEANTITSVADLETAGYETKATGMVKNCPIVPDGSTASKRHGDDDAELVEGWYDGQVVSYFLFEEAPLSLSSGSVPISPIYVSFNANPGEEGGGPASGFMTEDGSDQTHNVVATLPGDDGYSPLWSVNMYDNADFEAVSDLDSATDAEILESAAATVNCPIVSVN